MNKKLLTIAFVLLACVSFAQSNYHTPYDPGAARNTLSNVTPATGRAALGLGTISTKADTDYAATSALALRLDTVNASFTGDIDVAGDVGAATVNGVAPLTAAEKTQALVGSPTVDFAGKVITSAPGALSLTKSVQILLADDATADVQETLGLAFAPVGSVDIVCLSNSIAFVGAYVQGSGDAVQLNSHILGAITDSDTKLCLIASGSGAYTIKNRLGGSRDFLVTYRGRR